MHRNNLPLLNIIFRATKADPASNKKIAIVKAHFIICLSITRFFREFKTRLSCLRKGTSSIVIGASGPLRGFLIFNHLNKLSSLIDYWIWCCFALIAF